MSDKLQKLLAHAGLGSRREIEKWIADGKITVNGRRASLGDRATVQDRILVNGKPIDLVNPASARLKALLYHKPEGQICSRKDPKGRPSVFDQLPAIAGERWVSVGRLDLNTSGLLLFTNSGDLANRLMHPSTELEREYLARVRGVLSEQTIEVLVRKGVDLDGRRARFDSLSSADLSEEGSNHWYRVVIKEGRYREVRRMFEAVGHEVSRLKRIRYGSIKLPRDLRRGKASKMAPKQLDKLIRGAGLQDEFESQMYASQVGAAKVTTKKSRPHSARVGKRTTVKKSESRKPAGRRSKPRR